MPASSVGAEVRHLMRDKGFPQKRAVAASLSMERAGKFKREGKPRGAGRRGGRRSGRSRY